MQERREVSQAGLSAFFTKVYSLMGVGMLVTAGIAALLATTLKLEYLTFVSEHSWISFAILFSPIILSFFASGRRAQQSAGFAFTMFMLISASFGFAFTSYAMFYDLSVIAMAFVVTAIVFFTMSLVGMFGKKDLSQAGRIAIATLLGVILLSIVNIFMASTMLEWILNYAILGIFIVLTARDTQAIKQIYINASSGAFDSSVGTVNLNSIAVIGALNLYLDFLNIFLVILRLFGDND